MSRQDQIVELEKRYLLPTYNRYPIALEKGKGVFVFDFEGNKYLDFVSGLGVNALGHAHPRIVKTIRDQAAKVIHLSNLYYNEYQGQLAERLCQLARFENNHLELVVAEAHRMYAEKPYQDKLKAELAPHFGANFRLTVRVGSTSGTSIAAQRSRADAARQANAAAAIEDDPFVRGLVRDLGAEVVPSSVRPPEDAAGNASGDKR